MFLHLKLLCNIGSPTWCSVMAYRGEMMGMGGRIRREGIHIYTRIERKKVKSLSLVWLFATPWTVAYQALLSMGFSGQEYSVSCHFLLQEIFLTQGLNLGLPHCRQIPYHLSHQGSNIYVYMCIYGWFELLYGRNQHNFVKQLSSNLIKV